jgi:hypothetical protein
VSFGRLIYGAVLMLIMANFPFGLLFPIEGLTQNTLRYNEVYFMLSTIRAPAIAVKAIFGYCMRVLRGEWNPLASLPSELTGHNLIS